VTAHNQIKAVVVKGQLRQSGGRVAIRMLPAIALKRLQGLDVLLAAGGQIKIRADVRAAGRGCQGPLPQLCCAQGIEGIDGRDIDPAAAQFCRQRAWPVSTIEHPLALPLVRLDVSAQPSKHRRRLVRLDGFHPA